MMRVAVVGGNGKTGRAVRDALTRRGALSVSLGRGDWSTLADAMAGCQAAYLIAPNMHPDEPGYVAAALAAMRTAGVPALADVAEAAAVVLTEPGHIGATYELASRVASPAELATEAGFRATRIEISGQHPWLQAMFDYYDRHGLPVGTRPLSLLLGRPQ